MNQPFFYFQHFSVRQRDSAMKIGTDGVLLGAWAQPNPSARNLLDIGTGTGLIALMLAQRFSNADIDAIEVDPKAACEAKYNFLKSAWAHRFKLYPCAFNDFVSILPKQYDHIVCNPPFYINGYPIKDKSRERARSNSHLSYLSLFRGSAKLLNARGKFSLIVPIEHQNKVAEQAQLHGFYLHRETKVRGNRQAAFKRLLLEYARFEGGALCNQLTLETNRNCRTVEHQQLVNSFYLPKD